jgi:SAM-dependent methyltransferase
MSAAGLFAVVGGDDRRSGGELTPEEAQAQATAATWDRGDQLDVYANRELRPAEVMLLIKYREALGGRVLELGCGAGRLTGYLVALGGAVEGIDVSAKMVEYCRRTYPGGKFSVGDLRNLSVWDPGSFDVVVAPFNVLDVVSDEQRQRALDQIRTMLEPGGLLIMSSHNRAYAPQIGGAARTRRRNPIALAAKLPRVPQRIRNRRRLRRYETQRPEYAILNDSENDYSVLHYYTSRDAQERQFDAHGFELVECIDLDGRAVPQGGDAPRYPELHYVARRR